MTATNAAAEPVGEVPSAGEVVDLVPPKKQRKRRSKWTDRLNGAATTLVKKRRADGESAVVAFIAATPRSAATIANNVKVQLREGTLSGLEREGEYSLVTRGRVIYVKFKRAEK